MDWSMHDFEKDQPLGRGGQATVWKARAKATGEAVALKEWSFSRLSGDDLLIAKRRASTELQLLKKLTEDGGPQFRAVVGFRGWFVDDTNDSLVLVLELIDGEPLHKVLRSLPGGCLEIDQAREVLRALVGVLAALHARGIVYRDLKLPNLLLHGEDFAAIRLVDFGFAKQLDAGEPLAPGTHGLQRTYSIVGTPFSLAPEVVECGDQANAAGCYEVGHGEMVDWWQLGILAHELLLGQPPWGYGEAPQLTKGARIQLDAAAQLPEGAGELIAALLEPNPEHRLGVRGDGEEVLAHPFFASCPETLGSSSSDPVESGTPLQ